MDSIKYCNIDGQMIQKDSIKEEKNPHEDEYFVRTSISCQPLFWSSFVTIVMNEWMDGQTK
jgi:hypothetical protein